MYVYKIIQIPIRQNVNINFFLVYNIKVKKQ
jgi:hypothetical protein